MIEAYATGFPIRVSSYANRGAIGFTQPWAQAGANSAAAATSTAPSTAGLPTPGTAITAQTKR